MAKILYFIALCAIFASSFARYSHSRSEDESRAVTVDLCPVGNWTIPAGPRGSIFRGLSSEELAIVEQYMMSKKELNLIAPRDPLRNYTHNTIFFIEWEYPAKADALKYLDTNGVRPDRYARVTIQRPMSYDVVIYRVGPLPNPTGYSQVTLKRKIPFSSKNADSFEYGKLDGLFVDFFTQIPTIASESFAGYTYTDDCDKCLTWNDNSPRGMKTGTRKSWFWFTIDVDGTYLHTVGISIRIDHSDINPDNWKIIQVDYNGYPFKNAQELISSYNQNKIKKIRIDPALVQPANLTWSSLYPRGSRPSGDFKAPPRTFEPQGHRWTLTGNNTINYLDWRFDFTTVPTSGLTIFDARYKGDRVIYELGAKEAVATYAGYDPVNAGSYYLDSAWGLGTSLYELIPGADCPYNAQFFNTTFWKNGRIYRIHNSICVFEQDISYPSRRHFDADGRKATYATAQPSTALVVRASSPIYNYDYLFDYIFYPNGVVESKFSLGGFIQAIYYSNNNNQEQGYAHRVHDYTMGSLHQHIMAYKVDLDILGTANTFQRIDYVSDNNNSPFYDWNLASKKFVKNNIVKETGLKFDFEKPMSWVVTNQAKLNQWGEVRGYKIQSNAMTYFVNGDNPINTGASFAKYQISVTKQKDSENSVNSIFCQAVPKDCPQHLDDYIDGDDISNSDIVAWVAVGSMHLPISEDIPTQETYGYSHSFFIRPYNYFDSDPGMNIQGGLGFYRRDTPDGSLDTEYAPGARVSPCLPTGPTDTFNGIYYP